MTADLQQVKKMFQSRICSSVPSFRQRFNDICVGKVEVPGITKMKDVSSQNKPLSERVLNKIQDFQFDDVLFKYCAMPQVRALLR